MGHAPSRDILRFITCGSVDDGKSTLLGHFLSLTNNITDQQKRDLERAKADPQRYANLIDGLSAEQEQSITIDVAYRFFETPQRKFIVADCPGHSEYTRNMITGASQAQAAIILIDAEKGVRSQTRRHSLLCQLMGIEHFIVAVNKMDVMGYDQGIFDAIAAEYAGVAASIGMGNYHILPTSGLAGDMLIAQSMQIPWYTGPHLKELIEGLAPKSSDKGGFVMPVQWVNRPNADYRGFCGQIARGSVKTGDAVRVLPSGTMAHVAAIDGLGSVQETATEGQAITVRLDEELACARGDVLVAADAPVDIADQFEATLMWMSERPLVPGRRYVLSCGTAQARATVQRPKYEIEVNTGNRHAAKEFGKNAIGVANILLDRAIAFTPYGESRSLGSFILIDRDTHETCAAGILHFALRRSQNITWQQTQVTRQDRAEQKGQSPKVLWMTGLSGAGKTTLGNALERKLLAQGYHSILLDGDNLRHGLNKDLGFTEPDRIENIRRIGEVAKLMCEAGLIVITAFISPFRSDRNMVRRMFEEGEFVEVYINTPLAVAEERDVKGLYAKARAGEIANFTGIDSPYEPPLDPQIVIDTANVDIDEAADILLEYLNLSDTEG